MFQQKIIIQLCRYQILGLFIVFEVLLYIYIPNWILNSYSFLKYLATTLPTNVSNFSYLESLKIKTALKPVRNEPFQVLLTIQIAAKLQGLECWLYILQLKRAPPDSWNCAPEGNLKFKFTRRFLPRGRRHLVAKQLSHDHRSRTSSFCCFVLGVEWLDHIASVVT